MVVGFHRLVLGDRLEIAGLPGHLAVAVEQRLIVLRLSISERLIQRRKLTGGILLSKGRERPCRLGRLLLRR